MAAHGRGVLGGQPGLDDGRGSVHETNTMGEPMTLDIEETNLEDPAEALRKARADNLEQPLPAEQAARLVETAQQSFVDGMHIAAGATAIVLLASALLVAKLLREH